MEPMRAPPFEENLLALIKANGLTKADVARRAKVSPASLTRWTDPKETRDISAQDLLSLARVLGVDPYVLMGSSFEEPDPAAPPPRRGRPPVSASDVESALARKPARSPGPPPPAPSTATKLGQRGRN